MPQTRNKREVSCRDYALGLLNRQSHSSGGLERKLLRKGYDSADIKTTLKDLAELGFLNDQEYARIYFENLKK